VACSQRPCTKTNGGFCRFHLVPLSTGAARAPRRPRVGTRFAPGCTPDPVSPVCLAGASPVADPLTAGRVETGARCPGVPRPAPDQPRPGCGAYRSGRDDHIAARVASQLPVDISVNPRRSSTRATLSSSSPSPADRCCGLIPATTPLLAPGPPRRCASPKPQAGPGQPDPVLLHHGVEQVHGRRPDERGHETRWRGRSYSSAGVANCWQPARRAATATPLAHGHGLGLVMGDVERWSPAGGAEAG